MECKKCKKLLLTMTGIISLKSDIEPYEAGKEETNDIEIEKHVVVEYCEKCEEIKWVEIDNTIFIKNKDLVK